MRKAAFLLFLLAFTSFLAGCAGTANQTQSSNSPNWNPSGYGAETEKSPHPSWHQ